MSTEGEGFVTREGRAAIERWDAAKTEYERASNLQSRAHTELLNATNALGKWLCPDDARNGETFSVWDHKRLLIAKYDADRSDYTVTVRK